MADHGHFPISPLLLLPSLKVLSRLCHMPFVFSTSIALTIRLDVSSRISHK